MKDRKYSRVLANNLDNKLCEDPQQLKKIWAHRGLPASGDLVSEADTPGPRAALAAPWLCPGTNKRVAFVCQKVRGWGVEELTVARGHNLRGKLALKGDRLLQQGSQK